MDTLQKEGCIVMKIQAVLIDVKISQMLKLVLITLQL